jgi:hypothetical protein
VIASMLIRQDTNAAAGTQQIDHRLKSLLAIEQFQASLAARSAHVRVNEAIAKFLIDARVANVTNELRHQLGEQLPSSQMAQNEHHWYAGAKFPVHRFYILNLNPLQYFLRRNRGEFNATKKVGAESLEMATGQRTDFCWSFFVGKRDGNIAFCQVTILPGNEPGAKTEHLSSGEEKWHRKCRGNCQSCAVEKINDEIEHYRRGDIAAWRGRVNLAALCFNQYNVRGVAITFSFFQSRFRSQTGSLAAIGMLQFGEFSPAATT